MSQSKTSQDSGFRAWIAVLGGGVVAIGVLLAVIGTTVSASSTVLGIVGVAVLFTGVSLVVGRIRKTGPVIRAPPVEQRKGRQFVGEAFEKRANWAANVPESVNPTVHVDIRNRLRTLAQESLAAVGNNPETVDTGAWTDDGVAAGFISEEQRAPRFQRVSFRKRVRRTVDAIAAATLSEPAPCRWHESAESAANWTEQSHTTGHWVGLGALALFAFAAAAFLQTPGLLVMAATLLGLIGYVQLSRLPPVSLAVHRAFGTDNPRPGETVTVSVTVTNEGERILPDVRLVDGVPDRLAVADGTPRHATALTPGESVTFEYDVRVVYGEHEFEQLYVTARDASGYRERTVTQDTTRQTLTCEPGVVTETVPLHPQTTGVTGHVPSDTGGSGQEFRSVREYRRGDPLRRVDWNRLARTGEVATVELREEHAATVVLLIDGRDGAFCVPAQGELTALDRSLAGASQLFTTLSDDGDRVGLASIAPEWRWIAPNAGSAHRATVRAALTGETFEPQSDWHGFDPAEYVRALRTRLSPAAQLIVLSPLLDDEIVTVIRRLRAHRHHVTVFSPDPTGTETVGGTVARLERRLRLRGLQHSGVSVIDWPADESLVRTVARAQRGWRR